MSLDPFFRELADGGFTVTAEGDRLYVTPRERLTAEQVTMVRIYRNELLRMVREREYGQALFEGRVPLVNARQMRLDGETVRRLLAGPVGV